MSLEIYFKCVIACLLGNVCHIAIKYNSLYTDYKKANVEYSFAQFLKDDKVSLLFNALLSFALVYLADEFVVQSDFIMNKIKILFFFIGITGSYLTMQIRSVGKRKLRSIVDEKTNIADLVSPPEKAE